MCHNQGLFLWVILIKFSYIDGSDSKIFRLNLDHSVGAPYLVWRDPTQVKQVEFYIL